MAEGASVADGRVPPTGGMVGSKEHMPPGPFAQGASRPPEADPARSPTSGARCARLVEECRAELGDLRTRVKGASSNREKGAELLAAAAEAVITLEEAAAQTDTDPRRERQLAALAQRVQGLIDSAEAVVDVYGHLSALSKFARRVFAPGVPGKYEALSRQLQTHAQQARLLVDVDPLSRWGSRALSGGGGGPGGLSTSAASLPPPSTLRAPRSSAPGGALSPAARLRENAPGASSSLGDVRRAATASSGPSQGGASTEAGASRTPSGLAGGGSAPQGATSGRSRSDESAAARDGASRSEEIEAGAGGSAFAASALPPHLAPASSARSESLRADCANSAPLPSLASAASDAGFAAAASAPIGPLLGAAREDPFAERHVLVGGASIPLLAMPHQLLHKGKGGQSVQALLWVPPGEDDPEGSLGNAWYYVSRTLASGSLYVMQLSSGVRTEVRVDAAVTVLCLDGDVVWTGHRNGTVRAWRENSRAPLCAPLRVFRSAVAALAADERGYAWLGSSKGNVRCCKLVAAQNQYGGGAAGSLTLVGTLRWAGGAGGASSNDSATAAAAAAAAAAQDAMISSDLLREQAHYGEVTALAAAAGRVWTAGGSSAFVCLREWSQRGELLVSNDLRSMGSANAIALVSPVVRVLLPGDPGRGGGGPGGPVGAVASILSSAPHAQSTTEMPQVWQMLTAHDSGMVQIWAVVGGVCRPILRIGERLSPAKTLVVCESLGALATGHLDGRLLLRALPHPRSPGALSVSYSPGSLGQARLPSIEVGSGRAAFTSSAAAPWGVLGASTLGSVQCWAVPELLAAADARGVKLARIGTRGLASSVVQYDAAALTEALGEAAMLAATPSVGDALPSEASRRGASRGGLFDGGAAASWLLDFGDLSLSRVIGEGAFGKVYVGKWQETDVAVKVLTSLQALGISDEGRVASAGGALALDPEVLRTLEREVSIMVSMRHPCIILFMGVCLDPACIVTEFCARGSLYDLLRLARANAAVARALDWGKRLGMALDAAKGMVYLHGHRPPIIHRDLKSPNLLVDKHWRTKVTDFNLSRLADTGSVASSMVANNPRWHAPEVIHHQEYSKASDVYAYGLILWELLTWDLPFAAQTPFQIILQVAERGERPPIPSAEALQDLPGGTFPGSDEYVALIHDCWAHDPAQRPAFDAICTRIRAILEGARDWLKLPVPAPDTPRPPEDGRGSRQSGAEEGARPAEEGESVESEAGGRREKEGDVAFGAADAASGSRAASVPDPFDASAAAHASRPNPFDQPSAAAGARPNPFDQPSAAAGARPNPFDQPSAAAGARPNPFDQPSEAAGARPNPFDQPST